MEISPIILAKMLLVSFLFGIQSGVIFDMGRALRALFFGELKSEKIQEIYEKKLLKRQKKEICKNKKAAYIFKLVLIFFCDLLWVLYSFLGLIKINYSYNDGGFRAFTLLGVLAGFVCYYFTVSRIAVLLLDLLSFLLRFIIISVFDAVSHPFFKIYNNLVKKIKKRCEKLSLDIEKKRKKVYNVSEVVYENASDKNISAAVKISVVRKQRKGDGENEKK